MKTLQLLIYRLPLDCLAQALLLVSCGFLLCRRRLDRFRGFRHGLRACLLLWGAAVLLVTLMNRSPSAVYTPELLPFHSYREMMATGNSEITRTNFMNIVLFYPAGFLTAALLPERRPRWQITLSAAVLFAVLSLGIEYAQFRWMLGEPEIDDVIHNTLGAVLGTLPIAFADLLHKP